MLAVTWCIRYADPVSPTASSTGARALAEFACGDADVLQLMPSFSGVNCTDNAAIRHKTAARYSPPAKPPCDKPYPVAAHSTWAPTSCAAVSALASRTASVCSKVSQSIPMPATSPSTVDSDSGCATPAPPAMPTCGCTGDSCTQRSIATRLLYEQTTSRAQGHGLLDTQLPLAFPGSPGQLRSQLPGRSPSTDPARLRASTITAATDAECGTRAGMSSHSCSCCFPVLADLPAPRVVACMARASSCPGDFLRGRSSSSGDVQWKSGCMGPRVDGLGQQQRQQWWHSQQQHQRQYQRRQRHRQQEQQEQEQHQQGQEAQEDFAGFWLMAASLAGAAPLTTAVEGRPESAADTELRDRRPAGGAKPSVGQVHRCKGLRRGGSGGGGGARLRSPMLVLSLMLAAALQGIMVSKPCAAAEWAWIWGKSKAASAAVGSAAPAPSGGWHFSGLLPYGWRRHNHSSFHNISTGGGRESTSSRSRSSSSGSSNQQTDGQVTGVGQHVNSYGYGSAAFGGAGGGGGGSDGGSDAGAVKFSAGRVPVEVNPAGNVSALLEYDPHNRPPSRPKAPPQAANKKKATAGGKHRHRQPPSDAQLAFRELLTSGRLPFDPTKPYKQPAVSYKSSDFVFATGSFPARYILAQSTRCWRRGIRAFIAVNNTEDLPLLNEKNQIHHEHYSYFPDDGTGDLGPLFHGYMAGDTRAAMAPFLAHQYFGETYKWMLYGDDDTVFYMPAVKRLLAHLDPELPIALSDNLWFRARHPNLFAPRCLPCHLAVDADPEPPRQEGQPAGVAEGGEGPPAKQAKALRLPNITAVMDGYIRFLLGVKSAADMSSPKVQKLLRKNTFGEFNKSLAAIAHLPPDTSVPGVRYLPRPACPFCTAAAACTPTPAGPDRHNVSGAGCFASGGHGGAGMIFSVGLLRRLDPEHMKRCYLKIIKAPGGDGMLSTCLWEAGYAFTDPGASTMARYDGNYLVFSTEAGKWALHDPLAVLLKGKCDARCKWLLRNAASHHGRGRHFQNFEQSAAYLYGNMASYTATHKWLAFMAGRDDDLAELAQLAAAGPEATG